MTPCCERKGMKKGPWTPKEDEILISHIQQFGHDNWRALPKQAGLLRCGKSCRLRWTNYLRPGIKRGNFTEEEEETIMKLHQILGNRWSAIAARMPGRTDNDIKNLWHSQLKKRAVKQEPQGGHPPPEMSMHQFSNAVLPSHHHHHHQWNNLSTMGNNSVIKEEPSVCCSIMSNNSPTIATAGSYNFPITADLTMASVIQVPPAYEYGWEAVQCNKGLGAVTEDMIFWYEVLNNIEGSST